MNILAGVIHEKGWLILKRMFHKRVGSFGASAALSFVLLLSACATPNQLARSNANVSTGGDSAALKAFSGGIRRNPIFDAYAQRFPKQWDRNISTLWPKVRTALSVRDPLVDQEASATLARIMRTSDLMKDLAIVQREAMARLSAEHATQINALGIEHMTYLC